MLDDGRHYDVFILMRYFYRIGEPVVTDSEYEYYLNFIKQSPGPVQDYLARTYDDDPIPFTLLAELGIEPAKELMSAQDASTSSNVSEKQDLMAYLNEEKSLSINSVTNYAAAWEFFHRYAQAKEDLVISLKMDGINTKTLYLDGERKLSLSRGRTGNSFDFTSSMNDVLPNQVDDFPAEVKVYAECFVEYDYLETLRQMYDPERYKMAKSAAISLLRVQHKKECYKHLHAVVINVEGLHFKSMFETFKFMESKGFEVPEYKLIKWQEIPNNLAEFKPWLKRNVFDYMYERTKGIPSDGIVVEVNNLDYTPEISGMYADTQLALKFEQWNFEYYEGIVKNIIWEQRKVYASCRVEIEPILTKDAEARIINAFNLGILIDEGITVGSKVYFERNSDAYNVLIYGERLKKIKELKGE